MYPLSCFNEDRIFPTVIVFSTSMLDMSDLRHMLSSADIQYLPVLASNYTSIPFAPKYNVITLVKSTDTFVVAIGSSVLNVINNTGCLFGPYG